MTWPYFGAIKSLPHNNASPRRDMTFKEILGRFTGFSVPGGAWAAYPELDGLELYELFEPGEVSRVPRIEG